MLRMTLHGVEVTADSPDEAVGFLHAWAADGRIEVPPAVTDAQISEAVKKLEAHAIPLSEREKLNQLFLDRIQSLFTTGSGELRSTHTPVATTPVATAPVIPTPSASSSRPPRERRCWKCQRTFADKTCAKDCPACRPSYSKKAATTGAAVPAAPAKTSAPAKASAPPRPPVPKRTPDVAAAKGLLGRTPIKPNEVTKPCSSCGDKTRVSELDKRGRCRDCHPVGELS